MPPDWTRILGELLADHEITQRKQIEPLAARLAELEKTYSVPDEIADQVAGAIALLAESPAPRSEKAMHVTVNNPAPVPRSFRFERDEQNRIIAAHEGDE